MTWARDRRLDERAREIDRTARQAEVDRTVLTLRPSWRRRASWRLRIWTHRVRPF